jgi:hypothetical protein
VGEQARLAASKAGEAATVTEDLVAAKLELARLREMEVLYKRSILNSKAQLYGTPLHSKPSKGQDGEEQREG